jgi:hypothetical protein
MTKNLELRLSWLGTSILERCPMDEKWISARFPNPYWMVFKREKDQKVRPDKAT